MGNQAGNRPVSGCSHLRHQGFSLIEVMIVVAIIGIIAAIAFPSYREHVIKGRRAGGTACLMQAAQQMERFYTTQLTYEGSPAAFACDSSTTPHYTVTRTAVDAKSYTLSAAPQGAQATQDTRCGTLTIDQTGARNPDTAGCW